MPDILLGWRSGQKRSMPFDTPMLWSMPSNHEDDCYFCLMNVDEIELRRYGKRSKLAVQYADVPSAKQPTPHSDEVPIPVPKSECSTLTRRYAYGKIK